MDYNWDYFFYYDNLPKKDIIQFEVMQGIIQPSRSLYYDRQDSCGIDAMENDPQSISTSIFVKYKIINWIAYRNSYVTDGNNNTTDKRIAASQNTINIENTTGVMNIAVYYISMDDISQQNQLQVGKFL